MHLFLHVSNEVTFDPFHRRSGGCGGSAQLPAQQTTVCGRHCLSLNPGHYTEGVRPGEWWVWGVWWVWGECAEYRGEWWAVSVGECGECGGGGSVVISVCRGAGNWWVWWVYGCVSSVSRSSTDLHPDVCSHIFSPSLSQTSSCRTRVVQARHTNKSESTQCLIIILWV